MLTVRGSVTEITTYLPHNNTLVQFSFSSSLWLAVTGIIAMFIGGWTAGSFATCNINILHKYNGMWHGLLSWSMSTLLLFILIAITSTTFIAAGLGSLSSEQLYLPALQKTFVQSNNQRSSTVVAPVNNTQINSQINTNNQMSDEQLKQTIADTTNSLSILAFTSFIAFLLSAIAAAIGGYIGSNSHSLGERATTVSSTYD